MNVKLISRLFKDRKNMNIGPYPIIYNIAEKFGNIISVGFLFHRTEKIENIKVERLPILRFPFFEFLYPFLFGINLFFYYKNYKGILHSLDFFSGFGFKLLKKPIKLTTIRSLYIVWEKTVPRINKLTFSEKVNKYIEKLTVENSDYIISPSNYYKQVLIKNFNFPKNKIFVIPNGIDEKKFKPLNVKKENFALFVGSKNSYRKNFQLIKSLQNKIKIKIASGLTQDQLITLYNKALLTLHPSLSENCPKVVLESMSCGTPVVVLKDSPGSPELIENNVNGFVVAKSNYNNKVIELMKKPGFLKKIGKKAREKVLKKYTFDNMYKKYLNLYTFILKQENFE